MYLPVSGADATVDCSDPKSQDLQYFVSLQCHEDVLIEVHTLLSRTSTRVIFWMALPLVGINNRNLKISLADLQPICPVSGIGGGILQMGHPCRRVRPLYPDDLGPAARRCGSSDWRVTRNNPMIQRQRSQLFFAISNPSGARLLIVQLVVPDSVVQSIGVQIQPRVTIPCCRLSTRGTTTATITNVCRVKPSSTRGQSQSIITIRKKASRPTKNFGRKAAKRVQMSIKSRWSLNHVQCRARFRHNYEQWQLPVSIT